jgi:hypothetical protein
MLVEGGRMIGSASETTFPEAANAYIAVVAAQSGHLYRSFADPPNVVQPYGPLFYALNSKIAQISKSQIETVLRIGRSLSFVSYIFSALIVYLITEMLGFSRVKSFLASAMLLAQPSFLFWNATFRADSTTLFGMLLSLYFAIRDEVRSETNLNPLLCGLFAGLALLLKSSAIAICFAVLAVWVITKKYKQCFLFIIGSAAPVIVTFSILLWSGEPFRSQVVSIGRSIWSFTSGTQWMFSHRSMAMLWGPLTIGAFGCWQALYSKRNSRMVASFFLSSLIVGVATISQIGGDVNYFIPAAAGSSILLPFAIEGLQEKADHHLFVEILATLVLLATVSGAGIELYRFRYEASPVAPKWGELAPYKTLSDLPLLSLHGRDPEFVDPQSMHVMELTGAWDSSRFVQRIRDEGFDVILFADGTVRSYRGVSYFGEREIGAINSSYQVLCATGQTLVLEPRSRQITATPEILSSVLGQPCKSERNGSPPHLSLSPSAR